ncbi:hypothetical protein E4U59_002299 [Claviceps monticola]|nr:hypothetical protein E4U59_002299 [Claviceps monticola]
MEPEERRDNLLVKPISFWTLDEEELLLELGEAGRSWEQISREDLPSVASLALSRGPDAEVQHNRHQPHDHDQMRHIPCYTVHPLSQTGSVLAANEQGPRGPVALPSFSELAASVDPLSQPPPRITKSSNMAE